MKLIWINERENNLKKGKEELSNLYLNLKRILIPRVK